MRFVCGARALRALITPGEYSWLHDVVPRRPKDENFHARRGSERDRGAYQCAGGEAAKLSITAAQRSSGFLFINSPRRRSVSPVYLILSDFDRLSSLMT